MKKFEELYSDLEKDDKLKLIWQQAREDEKKANKTALNLCLILDVIILIVLILIIISKTVLININFNIYMLPGVMTIIVPIVMINLIIYICISLIFGKNKGKYKLEFKQNVIKKLIGNFYADLEYFPNKQMPQTIYKEANKESYNRYHSDDYLEATIDDKYCIDMAEVLTEREERHTDSDGNTYTTTTTIFHGLFAKIVIDKSIESKLKITERTLFIGNKEKLKMDSRRI